MNASKLTSITGLLIGALLFITWMSRDESARNEEPLSQRTPEEDPGPIKDEPETILTSIPSNASTRKGVNEPVAPSPAESTSTAPPSLTERDIEYIRANLEGLYANAARAELVEGYRSSVRMLPKGFINNIHKQHIAEGRYEVLDHPIAKKGAAYSPPEVKASPVAHGLVRVGILEDGRSVKTELELSELGEYASLAVELGWFEGAISRAANNDRGKKQR